MGTSADDFGVVRYNADGTLDTSFHADGKVVTDIGGSTGDFANAVALQPDGKIVVVGQTLAGFIRNAFAMVRYNADGGLDTSFGTGGKVVTDISQVSDEASAVAIQADGRIVVAGASANDFAVLRYNSDGRLDTSFGTGGKVITDLGSGTLDAARGVALQPDGKIVAAGHATFRVRADFAVVRYNADGGLDRSFGTEGKVVTDIGTASNDDARDVALQRDGKIVAAGQSFSVGGDFAVVRYNADGSLDPRFDGDGKVVTDIGAGSSDSATAVALQRDGKIVVAGTGDSDFAVVRYENDPGHGYWLVASDGGIFAFDAPFKGSMGGSPLNRPIVGMAADPDGSGYWMVASDGGIFAFDATFYGSMGGSPLNKPIVGMAAAPGGNGYYMVASDGGIFAFGAGAVFKGSMGATPLSKPVVGMATDPDGSGYWMVASDGGIFAFDAAFKGSMGGTALNKPVVGMAADPDRSGYWLVASDGGMFAFDAAFKGSMGTVPLNKPVVGMAADPDGSGYWLVASDGGMFAFDAVFKGSMGGARLNKPVVGMAVRP